MSEIQIGFVSVGGHIAFPVLVGIESAGIYVDVGIEFLDGYAITAGLKQAGQRR